MKKKALKTGIVIGIISMAVWHVGLNKSKTLFANFFNIEAMAKLESICLGEGDHNTGTCKKLEPADKGSACTKADWLDSKNCFGSDMHEFPD